MWWPKFLKRIVSQDHFGWHTVHEIYCFSDEDGLIANLSKEGKSLEEIQKLHPERFKGKKVIDGNVALNVGLECIIDIIAGLDPTRVKFDAAHAYIGVGETNVSANATQTCLQAEIADPVMQYCYRPMDTGYPQRSGRTLIFRATFDNATANFTWNEVVVANGSNGLSHVCLNRRVETRGTKPNYETWIMNSRVTFA